MANGPTHEHRTKWIDCYLGAGAIEVAWQLARHLNRRGRHDPGQEPQARTELTLALAEASLRRLARLPVTPVGLPEPPHPAIAQPGQLEEALALVDSIAAAAGLADLSSESTARVGVLVLEGLLLRGRPGAVLAGVRRWVEEHRSSRFPVLACRLHLIGAQAAAALGRSRAEREQIHALLRHVPHSRQLWLRAECAMVAGRWLLEQGRPIEAGCCLQDAAGLLGAMGRERDALCAQVWMGGALEAQERAAEALAVYRGVRQAARRAGDRELDALARIRSGLLLERCGRTGAARRHLIRGLRSARPLAAHRMLLLGKTGLMLIHARRGRRAGRVAHLERSIRRLTALEHPGRDVARELAQLQRRMNAWSPAPWTANSTGGAATRSPAPSPAREPVPAGAASPPSESRVAGSAETAEWERCGLLTRSPVLLQELRWAAHVGRSGLPVILLGETGTGKDLVARAIHARSGRGGPLVAFNAARTHGELAEAELFGYRRGAFTGATRSREGLLRRAHQGTLFLDEIAELSPRAQSALLRFLDSGRVRPLGSHEGEAIDARIIAASHRNLSELARQGLFRADLYFRLAGAEVRIPALRERPEDILPLAHRFAGAAGLAEPHARDWIDRTLRRQLLAYPWPGNVRQLRHWAQLLAHLVRQADEPGQIRAVLERSLMSGLRCQPGGPGQREPDPDVGCAHRESVRPRLLALMDRHHGNVSRIAREFGVHRTQVYRWLQSMRIDPDHYRMRAARSRRSHRS